MRARTDEVERDRGAARRLAPEDDVRRVAAERADVVLHPPQRRALVVHAVVARPAVRRAVAQVVGREEAEDAQSVVERHEDDVVGKMRLVRLAVGAAAEVELAGVDVHHDRVGLWPRRRRDDVQVQAVLAHVAAVLDRVPAEERVLQADVAEIERVAHARPVALGQRLAPPQVVQWWLCVPHAEEGAHAGRRVHAAAQPAAADVGEGVLRLRRVRCAGEGECWQHICAKRRRTESNERSRGASRARCV